jgi:hypothetical protein
MMVHKGFNRYNKHAGGAPRTDSPATQLTNAVITFLRFNQHVACRVNTIGVHGRKIAKESLGMADIVAVLNPEGKHLEVEVKIGRDRPRKEQLLRQERVQSCGGLYWFVSSFDEFKRMYDRCKPQTCICRNKIIQGKDK